MRGDIAKIWLAMKTIAPLAACPTGPEIFPERDENVRYSREGNVAGH
jgi:hypothetical protein